MQTWALNSQYLGFLCFQMAFLIISFMWRFWGDELNDTQTSVVPQSSVKLSDCQDLLCGLNPHPSPVPVWQVGERHQENEHRPLCPHTAHCFMSQLWLEGSCDPKQLLSHSITLRERTGYALSTGPELPWEPGDTDPERLIHLSSLGTVLLGGCSILYKIKVCRI